MDVLDLHGVKHEMADNVVRSFLNFIDLPCEIITGNSPYMREIVTKVVKEYEWFCHEKNSYNYGSLIIVEREI